MVALSLGPSEARGSPGSEASSGKAEGVSTGINAAGSNVGKTGNNCVFGVIVGKLMDAMADCVGCEDCDGWKDFDG